MARRMIPEVLSERRGDAGHQGGLEVLVQGILWAGF